MHVAHALPQRAIRRVDKHEYFPLGALIQSGLRHIFPIMHRSISAAASWLRCASINRRTKMADTNTPQDARNPLAEAAAAKLAQDNARVAAPGPAAGTNTPQEAKNPLAEAVTAKFVEETARAAVAGPAAAASKAQDAKNPLGEAVAAKLAEYNARTGADIAAQGASRDSAEAVQQGGRASGEALRQNAEAGAEVARRANEAGADAVRRGAEVANESFRRGAQAVTDAQRRIVQDAAQRAEEVSRKVAEAAQGTTENVRRMMALPNAAEGGLRDFQQGVTGLIEGVMQTNLRVAQELLRLANPAPLVEVQQRFAREYTDALVRNSATLVRAVRRTADETLRPLEQQIAQQQEREAANQNQSQTRFAAE
jgi:hypothetical protein